MCRYIEIRDKVKKRQIQAWLECVQVKKIIFSLAGVYSGKKVRFRMSGMC
jgi:hypothetical protein